MSLDARARVAVRELRDGAGPDVGVGGTHVMEQRLETRRRARRAALAVGSLMVVAAAAGFVGGRTGDSAPPVQPLGSPSGVPMAECPGGLVTCTAERAYRVALPVPVSVALPASFHDELRNTETAVEFYQGGPGPNAGVTVFEQAEPVKADGGATSAAGGDARQVADWLARRPFVRPTAPTQVTVGGLRGYRVDVVHRPGASLPATKSGWAVALTFTSGSWTAAVSPELGHSTYYLLDAPDGSLLVLWAWQTDGGSERLPYADDLVDALRFS